MKLTACVSQAKDGVFGNHHCTYTEWIMKIKINKPFFSSTAAGAAASAAAGAAAPPPTGMLLNFSRPETHKSLFIHSESTNLKNWLNSSDSRGYNHTESCERWLILGHHVFTIINVGGRFVYTKLIITRFLSFTYPGWWGHRWFCHWVRPRLSWAFRRQLRYQRSSGFFRCLQRMGRPFRPKPPTNKPPRNASANLFVLDITSKTSNQQIFSRSLDFSKFVSNDLQTFV